MHAAFATTKNSHEIRSQFCTCHDSSALVACANCDLTGLFHSKSEERENSQDFSYELIICMWIGSQVFLYHSQLWRAWYCIHADNFNIINIIKFLWYKALVKMEHWFKTLTHNRHPINHPHRRAMGHIMCVLQKKIGHVMVWANFTVIIYYP